MYMSCKVYLFSYLLIRNPEDKKQITKISDPISLKMDSVVDYSVASSSVNSTQNGMNPGTGSDHWLKLLVQFLNRSGEFALGRTLTLKDLDNLDAPMLQKILVCLLGYAGIFEESAFQNKTEVLLRLADTKFIPPMEFDATADYIYWGLKKILRQDDNETLHYGMLCFPEKFPKAVKNLLKYTVQFVLFVDGLSERFETIRDEVAAQQQHRAQLQQEIDEIKTKILEEINTNSTKKALVPEMEEDLKNKNKELQNLHEENAALEKRKSEAQRIYDARDAELNKLQNELDYILQAIKIKQSQIVSNPEHLIAQLQSAKQESEKLSIKRDELGQRLRDCSNESSTLENLISKIQSFVNDIHMIMEVIQDIDKYHSDFERKHSEYTEALKTKNARANDLKFFKLNFDKAKELQESKRAELESRIGQLVKKIQNLTQECKSREVEIEEQALKQFDQEEINCDVSREIDELAAHTQRLELILRNNDTTHVQPLIVQSFQPAYQNEFVQVDPEILEFVDESKKSDDDDDEEPKHR